MIYNELEEDENEQEQIEIKDCSKTCIDYDVGCHFKECKYWINFEADNNCDLVSIKKNGPLTLRQIGERIGVSYVRIKQIEDAALKKIRKTTSLEKVEH